MMYMMESRAVVDWVAVLVVGAGELVVVLMLMAVKVVIAVDPPTPTIAVDRHPPTTPTPMSLIQASCNVEMIQVSIVAVDIIMIIPPVREARMIHHR